MKQHHRVVLVFEEAVESDLAALADKHHVWLVSSKANDGAAERYWATAATASDPLAAGVTVFQRKKGDSAAALDAVLELVEDHHGEFAHAPPVDEVVVLGLESSAALVATLLDWGYSAVHSVPGGVLAKRHAGGA